MRGRRLFVVALVILCALPLTGNVPSSFFRRVADFQRPVGGFESAAYLSSFDSSIVQGYFLELPQLAAPSVRGVLASGFLLGNVTLGSAQLDAQSILPTAIPTGPFPSEAVFSPSGRSLFVGSLSGGVFAYSVEPATGQVSTVPGSPFATPAGADSVAVDPTGRFLYVAGRRVAPPPRTTFVSAFRINLATSALEKIADYELPQTPGGLIASIAVSRDGVYATNGLEHLLGYGINRDSGELTFRFDQQLDAFAVSRLVVTPDGRFVYYGAKSCPPPATSCDNPSVTELRGLPVAPNLGIPTQPFRTDGEVSALAVHPTLSQVYVGSGSLAGRIQALTYDPRTGELAENGPEVETDAGTVSIVVHPSGAALYGWRSGPPGVIRSFAIDPATGRLESIGSPILTLGGFGALAIQFLPRDGIAGVGVPYSQTVVVDGGAAPYRFSIVSGALPGGLTLDSSTGVISGAPTTAGVFDFVVRGAGAVNSDSIYSDRATTIQVLAPTVAPAAPTSLSATAVSSRDVSLSWQTASPVGTSVRVEGSLDGAPFVEWITAAPPGAGSQLVTGLSPATTYTFRVKAVGAGGAATSNTATVTTPAEPAVPCTPDAFAGCLLGGRFKLEGFSQRTTGLTRPAQVQSITPDTAYLWFFAPDNVEVVAKVISGCGLNNHYWAFMGGLTNVAVPIRITDTQTGAFREYGNPASTPFAPIQDTNAFSCTAPAVVDDGPASEQAARLEADLARIRTEMPELAETGARLARPGASQNCTPDPETVCLNGGRFQVRATFAALNGQSDTAHMVQLTDDTGYMWFFNEANVEAVVKVLSGCSLTNPGYYWVFAGGLTNVQVTITVTDTHTGATQTYENPQSTPFQPIQDTDAFLCQ